MTRPGGGANEHLYCFKCTHAHTHLFPETLDGEFAGLFVDPLPIHNVHSPQDQTAEPGQCEEHDGTASQSAAGTQCTHSTD